MHHESPNKSAILIRVISKNTQLPRMFQKKYAIHTKGYQLTHILHLGFRALQIQLRRIADADIRQLYTFLCPAAHYTPFFEI